MDHVSTWSRRILAAGDHVSTWSRRILAAGDIVSTWSRYKVSQVYICLLNAFCFIPVKDKNIETKYLIYKL